jgi:DNA repair photolyase
MSILYKIKKLSVWFHNFIHRIEIEPKVSDSQEKARMIARRLMADTGSELLMAPISGKCYVRNMEKDLHIILERGTVSIINGKYHYDVSIPDSFYDNLSELFRNRIERDRMKMEKEIRSKIEKSLDLIIGSHFPEKKDI